MTKSDFVLCANALKNYWNWENELYERSINLESTPASALADFLLELLENQNGSNGEWSYDPVNGTSWVAIWCSAPSDQKGFGRINQWITIEDAGALYDFVEEMRRLDWPERVENGRWLDE